ncbi:hypothetical protein [Brucella intermedia]|uniref:hypothetical protein n=1 Tax=Brucella intermedia TaxID=94625 RepID=UPI00224B9F07|nr:hypothetical protein [Brucella intermedia]
MSKATIDELMAKAMEVLGLKPDFHNATHLCGCGSKEDAVGVAFKAIGQSIEHDCLLWALQVHAASGAILHGVLSLIAGPQASLDTEVKIHVAMMNQIMADEANKARIADLMNLALKVQPRKETK